MSREEILRVDVPPGSRSKGYKSCHVRELIVTAELVHYRRECWILPNGKTVLAPLPQGIVGGYGPNLRRFCLMLHAQGQVTMDYDDLDKLLARLCRRKDELLKVLERPGTPLHTNASENDLRSFVTKRKISRGTMIRDGRVARDTMLGLMKTLPEAWPAVLAVSRRSDRSRRPGHSAAGHPCRDQSLAAYPRLQSGAWYFAHGMICIATRLAHQNHTATKIARVTSRDTNYAI